MSEVNSDGLREKGDGISTSTSQHNVLHRLNTSIYRQSCTHPTVVKVVTDQYKDVQYRSKPVKSYTSGPSHVSSEKSSNRAKKYMMHAEKCVTNKATEKLRISVNPMSEMCELYCKS